MSPWMLYMALGIGVVAWLPELIAPLPLVLALAIALFALLCCWREALPASCRRFGREADGAELPARIPFLRWRSLERPGKRRPRLEWLRLEWFHLGRLRLGWPRPNWPSLKRPSLERPSLNTLALVVGVAWGTGYGYVLRSELLPQALEQQPLILTGRVEGVVERLAGGQHSAIRWMFRVERCERRSGGDCGVALRRTQLTFYEKQPRALYEQQPQAFYEDQPQALYEKQPRAFYEEKPRSLDEEKLQGLNEEKPLGDYDEEQGAVYEKELQAGREEKPLEGRLQTLQVHPGGLDPRASKGGYSGSRGEATSLQPVGGERWRLLVRLKRPRGFANPGGFDYEAWLVAQRVGAVGVVEPAALNRREAPASFWSIDRWREVLKKRLDSRAPALAHADLLAGLTLGDGSGIAPASWDMFRATGTVHLFVVSGLQIAFTGGLALAGARCWWRSPWGHSRRRDYWLGIVPAFGLAWLYAQLAGFGLPLQRALIMFGCLLWALLHRRENAVQALQAALLLVLLCNPLAVLDVGCWFSFSAVAAMLLCASTRERARANARFPGLGALCLWWRLQYALFVVALPLLLATSGQFTLLALPANAVAVPWSTLLTMPLAFTALLFEAIEPGWAGTFWWLADLTLQVLWRYLGWLQRWSDIAIWHPVGVQPLALTCAALFAVLHLLPRGFPGRGWAWLFLLPVAWPNLERIAPGDCRVTVIDVGQGLSVLVETAEHHLLYDAGPPFGPQRTVAEFAVAPLLRFRGATRLDAVMISHADSDHAGGWPTIAAQFPVRRLLLGEPLTMPPIGGSAAEACRAGMSWRWDGVDFSVLHPASSEAGGQPRAGNNRSCVLRIRAGAASVLLPGDIERAAEYALHDQLAPVDILVAPHHGSRTSSTATFVDRVRPRHVVFSTGYRNRFAHPHPSVVERYAHAGAQMLNTADSGAITIDVQGGRVARIERWRQQRVHYWQQRVQYRP